MSAVSKAGKGIMKVLPVTDQLAKIIGSSSSTRPAAVKAVWEYIKTNNLQSQEKKSVIHCDSNLEDLSGKKMMKNTEIMGAISKHMLKE